MTAFGDLIYPGRAMFGGIVSSASRMPGFRLAESDDFHREPFAKKTPTRSSAEDTFSHWLEGSRSVAQQAQMTAQAHPDSPTALARLAHAQLAAADGSSAELAALRSLDSSLKLYRSSPGASIDVPAIFAAAHALIVLDKPDVAQSRLADFPPSPPLTLMRASLAADANQPQEALDLLQDFEFGDAASLRGYVYLRIEEPQRALAELRNAYRAVDASPNICANIATAFWKLGSRRKAIRFARQASRLAPGRKDVSLMMLNYLIWSGEFEAAHREIDGILSRGAAEIPELLVMQAHIAFAQEDLHRALGLLRRGATVAKRSGEEVLAAEISGRIAALRRTMGRISTAQALQTIRDLMTGSPANIALIRIFADLSERASLAPELRRRYEEVASRTEASDLLPVEVKLAYLEGRYSDVASIASRWSKSEALNPVASGLDLLFGAYQSQDWQKAALVAQSLVRRFPNDSRLANDAAYLLVLAGKPQQAARVLEGVQACDVLPDYVLLATRGLVSIAKGDIQLGMSLYRSAAELAERGPDGAIYRALVTEYQGMVLHLLGSCDLAGDISIRAAALPPVELPENWEDVPEFGVLQWVCERAGCNWPPMQS
jgi:tetratricopeptide (TPR) repeat protein